MHLQPIKFTLVFHSMQNAVEYKFLRKQTDGAENDEMTQNLTDEA
jgi:hypothetical protein